MFLAITRVLEYFWIIFNFSALCLRDQAPSVMLKSDTDNLQKKIQKQKPINDIVPNKSFLLHLDESYFDISSKLLDTSAPIWSRSVLEALDPDKTGHESIPNLEAETASLVPKFDEHSRLLPLISLLASAAFCWSVVLIALISWFHSFFLLLFSLSSG